MIPRSWNDFGAWPFALTSAGLVDSAAGKGSGDGIVEGSSVGSGLVGLTSVDVVCFLLFDSTPRSPCGISTTLLFLTADILDCLF